jgi:Tol biopolymer transport system component
MGRSKSSWGALLAGSLWLLAFAAAPASATFAGNNGKISTAWLDNDQGAHEEAAYAVVSVAWRRGSARTNVVSCTSLDGCPVFAHPAYSPDGTKLVYDELPLTPPAAPLAASVLILSAPNGSAPVTIGDPAKRQNYFEPGFLPSGRRLIFVRSPTVGPEQNPPPHGQIVTADLAGGDIRVVTSVPGADPVVSPDGRKVLFDHRGGIWVVGIGGGRPRRLVRNGGFPDWSPDGRSIVFITGSKEILSEVRADGTHQRKILGANPGQHRRHPLRYAEYPRFSPDGKQIAFSPFYYHLENDPSLMRIAVGGGRVRPLWTTPTLDDGGTDLGVAWQPLPAG